MLTEEIKVNSLPQDVVEDAIYSIEQSNPNDYTHGYFKYPCKFIPEIPRWAISKYSKGITNPVIYDPFSGSGTTLLEATLRNYQSYGSEIDQTAQLITKVKSTTLSIHQLNSLDDIFNTLIECINSDDSVANIAEISNIEHWFSEKTILHLGRLKYAINNIEDSCIQDFFKVCFASIIKKVSFADDVSPKPYVSSKIKKIPPSVEKEFKSVYGRYKEAICQFSQLPISVTPQILSGGAFGLKETSLFDIAITSPPYINAFDYARSMRLENLWLGFTSEQGIRDGKKNYVGTESIKHSKNFGIDDCITDSPLLLTYIEKLLKVDIKRAEIVHKFFVDMKLNMELVMTALKPNGRYVIVIGNSSIRQIDIESWKVIKDIGLALGYKYESHFGYKIKNPYIRIPRGGQGGNINIDHIIVLSK